MTLQGRLPNGDCTLEQRPCFIELTLQGEMGLFVSTSMRQRQGPPIRSRHWFNCVYHLPSLDTIYLVLYWNFEQSGNVEEGRCFFQIFSTMLQEICAHVLRYLVPCWRSMEGAGGRAPVRGIHRHWY